MARFFTIGYFLKSCFVVNNSRLALSKYFQNFSWVIAFMGNRLKEISLMSLFGEQLSRI